MLRFRRPSDSALRTFLAQQAVLPFSYPDVGGTQGKLPDGYDVDHTRVLLGKDESTYLKAIEQLKTWRQFRLGWVESFPIDTPIRVGATVAVLGYVLGIYWLNAARIVYAIDEQNGPIRRFGFAYGTLPNHVEMGEERFLIEFDTNEKAVWYDILAFSKPRHILAVIGYPFVRRTQKRFARGSAKEMKQACG